MSEARLAGDESVSTEWFFFSGGPGAPRYGDDPTKHAVDHDTETFVREVLQNANDQGLDGDEPVEVTFRILTLSGSERAEFLDAIRWRDGLEERLRTVSEGENGRGYEDLISRIERPEAELRLVTVEDQNTTGLNGGWEDDSNYAALVRDELYSRKEDESAGGSYGLGKSVLWTFSGASTVVFNSTLPEEKADDGDRRRLIARTKLPSHRLDDGVTYQGAGWLCRPEPGEAGSKPASLWGSEAAELAERLDVERPDSPGTSAMVVDFRDPTRDQPLSIEELAEEFVDASVKYFWPAMLQNDLRVRVDVNGDSREAAVRDVPSIRPFVDCHESRQSDDRPFEAPGDVAGVDVPVSLPDRAGGRSTPDGKVRLSARRASPADDDTYLNHLAMYRGAGMVVKYYDQSRIAYGDRNFHGVLACGEARDPGDVTPGDREVDRFLRYAEPPAHDDWQSTENLRSNYAWGFRTALQDVFETVRDGLRHVVSRTDGRGEALTDRVRSRFPIHGGQARTRPGPSPTTVFEIESSSRFEDDRWRFDGRIEPTEEEFEGWTAEVSLTGVGEDGSTYEDLEIVSVDAEEPDVSTSCRGDLARIVADGDRRRVSFSGESEVVARGDVRTGGVGETRLEIRVELHDGGG